jgi:ribosomal protein S18 acetylase RimI-like enzyme
MDRGDVLIRRATARDVALIVELSHALFQEDAGRRYPFMNLDWPRQEGHDYFTKLIMSEKAFGLVAEAGTEGAGYLVGYVNAPTSVRPVSVAELESMYVREAHRQQGVGRELVTRFLQWATAQGADRASVTAYTANERAIAFYEQLGFKGRCLTLESGLVEGG